MLERGLIILIVRGEYNSCIFLCRWGLSLINRLNIWLTRDRSSVNRYFWTVEMDSSSWRPGSDDEATLAGGISGPDFGSDWTGLNGPWQVFAFYKPNISISPIHVPVRELWSSPSLYIKWTGCRGSCTSFDSIPLVRLTLNQTSMIQGQSLVKRHRRIVNRQEKKKKRQAKTRRRTPIAHDLPQFIVTERHRFGRTEAAPDPRSLHLPAVDHLTRHAGFPRPSWMGLRRGDIFVAPIQTYGWMIHGPSWEKARRGVGVLRCGRLWSGALCLVPGSCSDSLPPNCHFRFRFFFFFLCLSWIPLALIMLALQNARRWTFALPRFPRPPSMDLTEKLKVPAEKGGV